eukprot:scaffold4656_cov261-Chaetoceros_neogracile.AAC.5
MNHSHSHSHSYNLDRNCNQHHADRTAELMSFRRASTSVVPPHTSIPSRRISAGLMNSGNDFSPAGGPNNVENMIRYRRQQQQQQQQHGRRAVAEASTENQQPRQSRAATNASISFMPPPSVSYRQQQPGLNNLDLDQASLNDLTEYVLQSASAVDDGSHAVTSTGTATATGTSIANNSAGRSSLPVPIPGPTMPLPPGPLGFGLVPPLPNYVAQSHAQAHTRAHGSRTMPTGIMSPLPPCVDENSHTNTVARIEQIHQMLRGNMNLEDLNQNPQTLMDTRRIVRQLGLGSTSWNGSRPNENMNVDVLERIHHSVVGHQNPRHGANANATVTASSNHHGSSVRNENSTDIAEILHFSRARTAALGSLNRSTNANAAYINNSGNNGDLNENFLLNDVIQEHFQQCAEFQEMRERLATMNGANQERLAAQQQEFIQRQSDLNAAQAQALAQQRAFHDFQAAHQQDFASFLWDDLEHQSHDSDLDDDDSMDIIGSLHQSELANELGMLDELDDISGDFERTRVARSCRRTGDSASSLVRNMGSIPSSSARARVRSLGVSDIIAGTGRRQTQATARRRSARVANNTSSNGTTEEAVCTTRSRSAFSVVTNAAEAPGCAPASASTLACAVAPERRRMTRSMVRAEKIAKNQDCSGTPSPSMTLSRKRSRSLSVDKKPAAKEPAGKNEDNCASSNCCICLDKPSDHELAKIDGCSHPYCFTCIEKWSECENTCPQCKSRFSKIERVHKLKKRKTNGILLIEDNVKKVKNRDQRADYRQQNSLQGFFAHMEGLGLGHGLNILFSAGGGLFNGPGPPEPMFMDRAPGAQAGVADTRSNGYAERVNSRNNLIAQRLFAPSVARDFGGVGLSMAHPGTESVASPPHAGSPSRPPAGRVSMRANRASASAASTIQRRFIRRVANLNGGGGQNLFFNVRDTRNGPRRRGGGGSLDDTQSDMLQYGRGASEAFFMQMGNINGIMPFGNETANTLEIMDDDED